MTVVAKVPVCVAGIGIFVEPGTARKGVLLIIVKLPVSPKEEVSKDISPSSRGLWK
jgi:hypothetical protein